MNRAKKNKDSQQKNEEDPCLYIGKMNNAKQVKDLIERPETTCEITGKHLEKTLQILEDIDINN